MNLRRVRKALVMSIVLILMLALAVPVSAASAKSTIKTTKATKVKAAVTSELTDAGKTVVDLTWSKNKKQAVNSYQIFRATTQKAVKKAKKPYKTVKGKVTKFRDAKVTEGKTYFYRVRGLKKVKGKKYYTKWSAIVKIKVEAPVADSVWMNANIYTVDEDNPTATALAVKGDRILFVGSDAAVQKMVGPDTKVTDVGGKTILPGLIEGHMHYGNLGSTELMLDAFWKPKDVILNAVKEAAEAAQPGEWIRGRGWMNTIWEGDSDFPTKEELDAVAPNNPVALTRADGHMAWYNSMAFELAGITKDTPNPQGGEYVKKPDGELWGVVTDNAMNAISAVIPGWSEEQTMQSYLLAQDRILSYGLTTEMDAGISVSALHYYTDLYESGKLKIRSYPLLRISAADDAQAKYVQEHAPAGFLYDNRMHLGGVKITTDGSLGARSAAMLEPYSDRPDYCGEYRFTDDQAYEVFKIAYSNNYQICTHTIGDGAAHQVINTLERLQKEDPREDVRLRIEHFQIVNPADITRAINLGILPSMQYIHATSDLLMAEDRIGHERMAGAYAWRTVLDQGSIIIAGTDAPVEYVNPWHNFYAGVTRMTRDGSPEGGWYAEQKVTREEVLKSYTIWAAYGQFEEDIKGSLEPGKLADFVTIDRDVMTCPEDEMMNIHALETVIGGEVVYTKDNSKGIIDWHGVPMTLNNDIIEENGVRYAPIADIANSLSAATEKDGDNIKVTYKDASVTVPVKAVGGVDYVEVEALFKGLGQAVSYNENSNSFSITKARS